MAKTPDGFVSLSSLKPGIAPQSPLLLLREIYFKTSKRTIEHDFAHAIEILKSLPSEEERQKAHVYMEGLAEMRKEWGADRSKRPASGDARKRAPARRRT